MRAIRSARFVLWLGCVLAYFAATVRRRPLAREHGERRQQISLVADA